MLSGMKLFVWFALGVLVFWLLRRWRRPEAGRSAPAERPAERMVRCAYCGVNQPVSESIAVDDLHFCCEDHRWAGRTPRADAAKE